MKKLLGSSLLFKCKRTKTGRGSGMEAPGSNYSIDWFDEVEGQHGNPFKSLEDIRMSMLSTEGVIAHKTSVEKLLVYTPHGLPYLNMQNLLWWPYHKKFNYYHTNMTKWVILDILGYTCILLSTCSILYNIILGLIVSFGMRTSFVTLTIKHNELDLIKSFPLSIYTWGVTLILESCIFIWNQRNCVQSMVHCSRGIFFQTMIFYFICLLIEGWLGFSVLLSSSCFPSEMLYNSLYDIFDKYGALEGEGHPGATEYINQLQMGLGCCGVNNWTDYLSENYRSKHRKFIDNLELYIPHTCCQQAMLGNLDCAKNIHRYFKPRLNMSPSDQNILEQVVNPQGCVEAIKYLCEHVKQLLSEGLLYVALIRSVCMAGYSWSSLTRLKTIANIIRESRQEKVIVTQSYKSARADADREEYDQDDDDLSENEYKPDDKTPSTTTARERGAMWQFWQTKVKNNRAPPPTEDQVKRVKAMTFVTQMMAKIKPTTLGKQIQIGRETVVPDILQDAGTEVWDKVAREILRQNQLRNTRAKLRKATHLVVPGGSDLDESSAQKLATIE